MSILLFIFQIINVILIILTTIMLQNKFTKIQLSLEGYCDKRVYKTEKDTEFIRFIIDRYKLLYESRDEEPDIERIIVRKLQQDFVGKFKYSSVKNLALRGKNFMWAVLGVQALMIIINHSFENIREIILLNSSILLTLMMTFYVILKDVQDKEKTLIDGIIYYVRYDYEEARKQKIKKSEETLTVHKVKQEPENKEKMDSYRVGKQLSSKDIAELLNSI